MLVVQAALIARRAVPAACARASIPTGLPGVGLAARLGRSPSPRSARRRAPRLASSGGSRKARSASICRATSRNEIIEHPERLALHGERREIFVLFSDLEGFTKLSHAIEPEMVAKLLNRYLDMLSQVVLDHGGMIDKFVGDAVVAFWGAPIARPDDGERAARAGYAMWQAGEEFRKHRRPRRAADRQDPRRAAFRRGGDRQFRRRGPHPVHRARRQHEHRGAARGGQQGALFERHGEPRVRRALGPRLVAPDGPRHPARPQQAGRAVRAGARFPRRGPCRARTRR